MISHPRLTLAAVLLAGLAAACRTAQPPVRDAGAPMTAAQRAADDRQRNDWASLERYRAANAALPVPGPGEDRVVFYGNSITDAWAKYFTTQFPGKAYVGRGISGQTTPQMLVRFRQDVVALRPRAVVILAGTNDIAGNTGPSTLEMIEDNLAAMTEIAHANGIRVVLSSVLPVHDYPWKPGLGPAPKIVALNTWIRQYAARVNEVYLDYHSALADARQGMRADLAADGVHPTEAGYRIMAPLAESAIAEALRPAWRASELPPEPPAHLVGLLGEYGPDSAVRIVLERGGRLFVHAGSALVSLQELPDGNFEAAFNGGQLTRVAFARSGTGRATGMVMGSQTLTRRQIGPESGNQLLVPPLRPIAELRREALAASPPAETGPFRPSALVELTALDSTIRLEIRYATSNNLFGTPFYSQARAFLQRPAAEALVRASAALRGQGYGLLVHDGYRPWYVTKMFWDASPADKHIFVADPSQGSRHNRGAAVDLTLYDRATGQPVEMVSTYDETSARAYPNYPGGTSRQRWYRELLRHVMEAEHFSVYDAEWWHFDYADWRQYAIGNADFQAIAPR